MSYCLKLCNGFLLQTENVIGQALKRAPISLSLPGKTTGLFDVCLNKICMFAARDMIASWVMLEFCAFKVNICGGQAVCFNRTANAFHLALIDFG